MRIYKFVIPEDAPRLLPDQSFTISGCLAVAVAEDVEAAKAMLKADAQVNGEPVGWLDVADVTEFDLTPGIVAWAYL